MSGWRNGDEQMLADHQADNVRGFPFSREAERRLRVDTEHELEQRMEGLLGELDAISERLDSIANNAITLAHRYNDHGGKELVVEGLRGGAPELKDLASQLRAVKQQIETAP